PAERAGGAARRRARRCSVAPPGKDGARRHRGRDRRSREASRDRAHPARAVDQARPGARGRRRGCRGARRAVARYHPPSVTRRREPMIRVVIYLLVVAAVALGAVWLADRPGEVVVTWPWLDHVRPGLGQGIAIDLGVVVIAIIVIALATVLLFWLIAALLRTPGSVACSRRPRPRRRGYQAASGGRIALGAGDLKAARRLSAEARRYAAAEPLALLLAAQTAQLAGNRPAAEIAFRKMADHGETRLLGLHGLFVEAQRRSDHAAARAVAEEAVRANPAAGRAAQA